MKFSQNHKTQQYLDQLLILAKREAHKSPMAMTHGCVIVNGRGQILSSSFNHHRRKPIVGRRRDSHHAEVSACRKVPRHMLAGTTLVVIRINRQGMLLPSPPCEKCTPFIHKMQIKRVYHS